MLDKLPINWPLISHPVNWLTIFVMIILGGFAVELVLHYFNGGPPTKSSAST
jgi:hypothetical protein